VLFEKKKIQIETLGEYLSAVRKNSNLSPREVSKKTGISPRFLQALEAGDFAKLPPAVYVGGFLEQLGCLYNVEAEVLVGQYKKELNILEQLKKRSLNQKSFFRRFLGKIIITPKLLSIGLGALFVAVTIGYIIWQVVSINRTPSLEVYQPRDQQAIVGSSVEVSGKTDPDMMITVNQENVFVGKDGKFKTQVGISSGPKELVITAKNRFDKSVSKTLTVVGQDQPKARDSRLELKLVFTNRVVLVVSLDGRMSQTLTFQSGDVRLLQAEKKIVLSVSDAGAVKVSLNGNNLGALGRAGEKLENIPFFAESANIK
jgi:cytoskeletal protein RodZ